MPWPAPLSWDVANSTSVQVGDIVFTTRPDGRQGPFDAFRIIDDPRRGTRPVAISQAALVHDDAGHHIECPPGNPLIDLDTVGASIWGLLDGTNDLGGIADDLSELLGVTPIEQLGEVVAFVARLDRHGLITPGTGPDDDEVVVEELEVACDFRFAPYAFETSVRHRPLSRELLLAVEPPSSARRCALAQVVDTVRSAVGDGRTVWGVKSGNAGLVYELYFYLLQPPGPGWLVSLDERVDAAFSALNWNLPRRISTDVTIASAEFRIEDDGVVQPPMAIDLYAPSLTDVGAPAAAIYTDDDLSESVQDYQRFVLPEDRTELSARLGAARFAPTNDDRAAGADHWLQRIAATRRCESVFCSYKSHADGIYLCHVDVHDVVGLLEEFSYPDHLRSWVTENLDALSLLYFDLEFDYLVDRGEVKIEKTGFYGFF